MKICIALLAWLFLPLSALAEGANSSGGGGAYVCRDAAKNILSSRLVDLWEGANTYFQYPKLGTVMLPVSLDAITPAETQLANAVERVRVVDPNLAQLIEEQLLEVKSRIRYLPDGVSLTLPNDLVTDYFPTGCPPEGMMRYNGVSGSLDIDRGIFEKLATPTDEAAAYLHEAIYKIARGKDPYSPIVTNSIVVRRLVACIFTDSCVNAQLFSPPVDRKVFRCQSEHLTGFAFQGAYTFPDGYTSSEDGIWHFVITEAGQLKFPAGHYFSFTDRNINFDWLSFFEMSRSFAWLKIPEGQANIDGALLAFQSWDHPSGSYLPVFNFQETLHCTEMP